MISQTPTVTREAFEQGTGWQIKPEGACKGDICIPLSADAFNAEDIASNTVQLEPLAAQIGLPVVHDALHHLWAVGPEAIGSRALTTAEAPALILPDVDGNDFALSSLRGHKVLMVAWAPY